MFAVAVEEGNYDVTIRFADEVLLAHYSSHEYPQPKGVGNNPANIYLAHLKIRHQADSKNEVGDAP